MSWRVEGEDTSCEVVDSEGIGEGPYSEKEAAMVADALNRGAAEERARIQKRLLGAKWPSIYGRNQGQYERALLSIIRSACSDSQTEE